MLIYLSRRLLSRRQGAWLLPSVFQGPSTMLRGRSTATSAKQKPSNKAPEMWTWGDDI